MIPVTSRIWMMNIALATGFVIFGFMAADVWTQKNDTISSYHLSVTQEPPPPVKRIIESSLPDESVYNNVSEKNLFSPDRAESLLEGAAKPELPDISKQNIFLYGVVTLGGKKQALINYPESGTGASRGQAKDQWVKVGDVIDGLNVAEIEKGKIVLKDGTLEHEIFLHDENKPVRQQRTVSQGSSTPVVVVTESSPEPVATSDPPGAAASQPRSAVGKGEPDNEYKIIESPFGPIKRRIR